MAGHTSAQVTILLRAWHDGDQAALDKLIPVVHSELHRLAHRYYGARAARPYAPDLCIGQ